MTTHLECIEDRSPARLDVTSENAEFLTNSRRVALGVEGVRACRDEALQEGDGRLWLSLTCILGPSLSLVEAHAVASAVEERVRALDPRLTSVTVHAEPWAEEP